MLKTVLLILLALAVMGGAVGAAHLWRVAQRNKKEMAPFQGPRQPYTAQLGKVLVIYYSWTGHTQAIAQQIAQHTQADVFRLETSEPLPSVPWAPLLLKRQLSTGRYPQLKHPLPDVSAYDTVFVGGPVWWYTAATPLLQFLREMDFQHKNVVPFSTQGSNYGTFFEDFAQQARNAQLKKGASFNNLGPKYDEAVANKIILWLNSL